MEGHHYEVDITDKLSQTIDHSHNRKPSSDFLLTFTELRMVKSKKDTNSHITNVKKSYLLLQIFRIHNTGTHMELAVYSILESQPDYNNSTT